MSKPVIFVIGATGNIGSATLQALSSKYAGQFDIRAGVRNPDKADKLRGLAGVTVVQATQGDKDNLVGVLKGVDALYIVPPPTKNRAELIIKTAEAAKAAGVKFVLIISSPSLDLLIDTILGQQLNEAETAVAKLNIPVAYICFPFFMENYWALKDPIQSQSSIFFPLDPSKPFATVAVEDAGKAGAAVLAEWKNHENKSYTIVSDRHSYGDVAKAFTEVLGKEVKYVRVPYDAAKQSLLQKGLPEWQIDGLMEMYKLIDAGSPATTLANFTDFEKLTGEKPTSLKVWLSKVGEAFK